MSFLAPRLRARGLLEAQDTIRESLMYTSWGPNSSPRSAEASSQAPGTTRTRTDPNSGLRVLENPGPGLAAAFGARVLPRPESVLRQTSCLGTRRLGALGRQGCSPMRGMHRTGGVGGGGGSARPRLEFPLKCAEMSHPIVR